MQCRLATCVILALATIVAGCSRSEAASSSAQTDRAETTGEKFTGSLPRGATIGPSGYATILGEPPAVAMVGPAPPPLPPPPPPPMPYERLARERPTRPTPEMIAARKSMGNPDEAARKAAMLLDRRLKVAERANYVGVRVVRDPRARFAFQFRRNAVATLARYSRDPRFTTREGGLPTYELQPTFDTWWKRFEPFRLVGGGAVYQFDGVVRFDMNIDEAGFREIAARERWTLPERLELRFSPPRNPRSIDPALARYVRVFPREDRRPAITRQALLGGRIILRDGCFRLVRQGQAGEPLVIFDRDAELGLDGENYMILARTGSAGSAPRIGELVSW